VKIGQVQELATGNKSIIIFHNEDLYQLNRQECPSTLSLLEDCDKEYTLTKKIHSLLNSGKGFRISESNQTSFFCSNKVIRPVDPPEAWAVGVTYKRQATEHDNDLRKKKKKYDSLYQFVYENARAEVFFKGLSRTIVGPYDDLWLRPDSQLTMPEAEMVLVFGKNENVVGVTLGNDLTAWDIESECPLYLNQAKIWTGSGSIGPYIVPIENIPNLYDLDLLCEVSRDGETVLNSGGNTSGLKRTIEELSYYLCMANPVEPGTIFYTGTACVIDHEFSLKEKDIVKVSCPLIGVMKNSVYLHKMPIKNFINRRGD
jgi:2-dehydro-3-deoxy-D-arabinonate dehydratase